MQKITIRKFLLLYAVWLMSFTPIHSWAVACDVIFSNGIQATGAAGNISLNYHSIVTGGSATLKTKNLTDNTQWVACSGSSCAASGTASPTASVSFSTGTGGGGAIAVADSTTLSKASGDYSTVNVGQQATLTFSTANGIYKTTGFTTNYKSVVQLQSGDYWINGNLTLAQETVLKRVATSGTTRIWVNGNINMAYKISTQGFSSDQLLIYTSGSIVSPPAPSNADQANLSAFIYAVGNVNFDFMSVINGGVSSGSFTAGNQVTVNYQPSAFATANFAPLCSGVTVAPVLLGSWHMDEGSWNGTAGEIIDSSGKGNHGRSRIANGSTPPTSTTSGTSAYSTGAQSTCRYGAFDGTGAPTRAYTYVELSGFPTLPNGFTFAAWIRSTNAGAQHQRILVRDDADNGWGLSLADGTGQPELRFFNRNVTNNGAVTGQGKNPNCGVFCVDTNPIIASNTWYYVAAAVDTSVQTVTLYVYNQAGALQAKAVGAYSGTWKDGTGTAAIGGETAASSEGQQPSFHFLGNIDEVNIYSGALPQASIEALLPSVRTCPAPDHYELQVAATNVACAGADVTVRACADSSVPCNQDNSVSTNVTLGTTAGSLNNTILTLVGGSATTKLQYGAAAEGATATINLFGEVTAATNNRKCCTGTSSCSVANSCLTTFRKAGFIFPGALSGTSSTIPTQVAGVASNSVASPSNSAYIRAIQTSATANNACVARFSAAQNVPITYQCINPASCISGQTLSVNGTVIPGYSASGPVNSYASVPFNFDANGNAPLNMTYSDVGQIHFLASLNIPQTTTEPAYTLTGTSNDFVVKPHTLAVILPTSNPKATSAAGAGAGFLAAGTNFTVKIEARNANNGITPNFGKEKINPETVTLNNLNLVYPSGGTATPLTLGGSFTATTAGTFVNDKVSWDQVGSFTVEARLGDGNYLGVGDVGQITTSDTVGRIYPDHFRLDTNILSNSCQSFTYFGASMNLSYKLIAESTNGALLTNYGGNYSTTLPSYIAENKDDGKGSLGSRFAVTLPNSVTPTWVKGVFEIPDKSIAIFARASLTATEDPLDDLKIGISIDDKFDIRKLQSLDMNANSKGACGATCGAKQIGSSLAMRYGRLRLDDAFGPETYPLNVNFVTEYWTGNRFIVNVADSCTLVPRAVIKYPLGFISTDSNREVPLTGGSTIGMYANSAASTTDIIFKAGTAGQYFTSPNGGKGKFAIDVDLTTLPWLSFDWNQDNKYNDSSLPRANFEFGSYRGHDRVIYWRERLQ